MFCGWEGNRRSGITVNLWAQDLSKGDEQHVSLIAISHRPTRHNSTVELCRVGRCEWLLIISARCNIYIARLCYDVSVRLSVRLSVTEVHWRIIANLGFKFRYKFTAHCGRGRGNLNNNISRYASSTARPSCNNTGDDIAMRLACIQLMSACRRL